MKTVWAKLVKDKITMAQIDKKFSFGNGISVEMHAGNPQGSSGQNAQGPSDAPVIGQKVVTAKQVNTTVGSSHVVNPA
jgi:hypothetical protein